MQAKGTDGTSVVSKRRHLPSKSSVRDATDKDPKA